METWVTIIIAVLAAISTFLTTGLPSIVKLVNAVKARKAAVTEAEKKAAENDMLYHAQQLIASAEQTFKAYDTVVKQQGGSAGALKKDNVMTKLQAYAMQNGYVFDESFWSQKVDDLVAMTKEVNA